MRKLFGSARVFARAARLGVLLLLLAFPEITSAQSGQDFRLSDLKLDFTLFGASVGSGARALAMGGAFIAIADDGTAASWNPAGLGVLEEGELSLNWQPIFEETLNKPATRVVAALPVLGPPPLFGDTGETVLTRSAQALDFASFAYPFRARGIKFVPQFSYQRVVPALDATFEGGRSDFIYACDVDCREQQVVESSAFLESEGGINVYAASLGFMLGERLQLGASLNWWRGDTTTRIEDTSTRTSSGRDFPGENGVGTETKSFNTLNGTETLRGFSVNLGAIMTPTRWARVGVVFKTPFRMHRTFEESLETSELAREDLPDSSALDYRATFSETVATAEGNIDWPMTLGFGFAWLPTSVATISTDFTWTNWSEARLVEEVTSTDVTGTTTERVETFYPAPSQVDAWQYRLGAELVIVEPSFAKLLAIPLRGGVYLDRQYFLDFQGNDSLNHGLSGGFGLVWSKLTLDVAYVYQGSSREPAARVQELPTGVIPGTDGAFGGYKQEGGKAQYSSHQLFISAIVRF